MHENAVRLDIPVRAVEVDRLDVQVRQELRNQHDHVMARAGHRSPAVQDHKSLGAIWHFGSSPGGSI